VCRDKLTTRQEKFAQIYEGNGVDAARKAGYTGGESALGVISHKLLKNAKIVEEIQGRQSKEIAPLIASREQRQKFWTETMNNSEAEMRDRLKASELLGKSEADFIDRTETGKPGDFTVAAKKAHETTYIDDVTDAGNSIESADAESTESL
jgi:phage terminase small subunit